MVSKKRRGARMAKLSVEYKRGRGWKLPEARSLRRTCNNLWIQFAGKRGLLQKRKLLGKMRLLAWSGRDIGFRSFIKRARQGGSIWGMARASGEMEFFPLGGGAWGVR